MSRGMCFSYGGFHFIPVRQFEKDEGDFFALSKRLAIDPILGLSADAERQKHPYSHKDFYAATADKTCDIFRCLENRKLYVPGDREVWIGIELSAREFRTREEGLDAWNRYFAAEEESLRERMFFVTDRHGQCVATASAYFDIEKGDDGHTGWLHWVAVRRASQGLGLDQRQPLFSGRHNGYSGMLIVLKEIHFIHGINMCEQIILMRELNINNTSYMK